mmetsp:Transcript_49879/g.104060  ORF Transcript_49879/g.104060 Transcript_49879/m.104060 type:complete len:83 (+) Transcript_49879:501-749(+)
MSSRLSLNARSRHFVFFGGKLRSSIFPKLYAFCPKSPKAFRCREINLLPRIFKQATFKVLLNLDEKNTQINFDETKVYHYCV